MTNGYPDILIATPAVFGLDANRPARQRCVALGASRARTQQIVLVGAQVAGSEFIESCLDRQCLTNRSASSAPWWLHFSPKVKLQYPNASLNRTEMDLFAGGVAIDNFDEGDWLAVRAAEG